MAKGSRTDKFGEYGVTWSLIGFFTVRFLRAFSLCLCALSPTKVWDNACKHPEVKSFHTLFVKPNHILWLKLQVMLN